ncbi:M12 family metallopeptidase [Leptospira kanakyensis]|uniref:M12 family metallopeptidase n=1 Tax=Leptospira kanakyensis TaxID=2484968 RepID=UPI00223DA8A2|nr:M12 family metallopeptidase [Leptospira kanakyensis]MCW7481216.1 M12 family metallopeptidase [Leptospira kanakyensis]
MKNVAIIFFVCLIICGTAISPSQGGKRMSFVKPPVQPTVTARSVEVKGTRWKNGQTIRILFLGGTNAERQMVRSTAIEWTRYANLTFEFFDSVKELRGQKSNIRIDFVRGAGANSAIGKEAEYYKQNERTMNLEWVDEATILHEFGHALGLDHEHQNPTNQVRWNRNAIFADLSQQGWTIEMVDDFIIKPHDRNRVNFSQYDPQSIMVYSYPDFWTLDGSSVDLNVELSEMDKINIAKMYPGKTSEIEGHQTPATPVIQAPTISGVTEIKCQNLAKTPSKVLGGSSFSVENHTEDVLTLYWLNAGKKIKYATIHPDSTHEQETYIGHLWVIDVHSQCKLAFTTNSKSKGKVVLGKPD